MVVNKGTRLSKIAREFNVGISTIVDFLHKKGFDVDSNPNTKISSDLYDILVKEYSSDISAKKESERVSLRNIRDKKGPVSINDVMEPGDEEGTEEGSDDEVFVKDLRADKPFDEPAERKVEENIKVVGKIDIDSITKKKSEKVEEKKPEEEEPEPPQKEPVQEEKTANPPVAEKEVEEADVEETTTEEQEEPASVVEQKTEPAGEKEQEDEETLDFDEEEIMEDFEEDEEDKFIETKIEKINGPTVVGKIDLESMNQRTRPPKKTREQREKERKSKVARKEKEKEKEKEAGAKEETREAPVEEEQNEGEEIKTDVEKLSGPTVVGKIKLPDKKKPVASSSDDFEDKDKKKKRKRIRKDKERVDLKDDGQKGGKRGEYKGDKKLRKKKSHRQEVSEEDVQKQIKDTLARLTTKGSKSKGSKYRREKREAIRQELEEQEQKKQEEKNVLNVTEFVSVNELASMMDVPATDIISTCMNLGLFVSINQRLDAETMSLVADEFGYKVEFSSEDMSDGLVEEEDQPEDLEPRPPIVTVMGHVDHGKTKLLDYVRHANVIAGEAGGITQHIGAYNVTLEDGRQITFLDTPGHEAFTAMRARGAQITDVAIIVVAADDGVMPQTVEAINHASAAGVPIVFAINKIDKPTSNPEKIKEELANMNYLVEDWGGKYQSQEISAKNGINIEDLLEKVLLEAELLELKANPERQAVGTVIESSLDRGRGYTATMLVETGTLHVGDIVLAGTHTGHVKAMFNERGGKIDSAGPAMPVVILGLNGAPQAGDRFNVMENDRDAKEVANKREQLQREQGLRTQKHITLDEIGRRIAIGNFQELNLIVKGDVDGSVEALADSLIKLTTEEIQVNVKHKAVGQISESDVLLAAASDAIIIGFQVRPSLGARKLAEKEEIDIRLYSIIYDAIEDLKSAMEGMLSPEIKEEITGTAEIKETFKITKVGTIAGCMVREGKINRENKVRVIREGIVVYTGELGSLKRFKDDVKEVVSGLECGLNIENFNDIKVGDIVESFREIKIKKKL
jgi:translation initiation factor IF-2